MRDSAGRLYPPLEANYIRWLKVSDIHTLYYEESGNPHGQPVVVVHGGPGGGTLPLYRQYFDPDHYRIIMFDQRGAGKSRPHAELTDNTTWHLVADMEQLRRHLGIDRWMVFGGSWGSTLSLAYAETHPNHVTGLVLRGIFMCRPEEIRWFYQDGAHWLYPDQWEPYLNLIPPEEREDMVSAYYRRLTSTDVEVRLRAARAWSVWEGSTSRLLMDPGLVARFDEPELALSLARIECHYFMHDSWFEPNQLLRDVGKIRQIPGVIVQGRYDVVCPAKSAWELHRAWPEADLIIVPDAGHSMTEPGIASELVRATDRFRGLM